MCEDKKSSSKEFENHSAPSDSEFGMPSGNIEFQDYESRRWVHNQMDLLRKIVFGLGQQISILENSDVTKAEITAVIEDSTDRIEKIKLTGFQREQSAS